MKMQDKNSGKIESILVSSNMWLINFINVWLCIRKRSLIYITPFSLFIFDYDSSDYFGLHFLTNEIHSSLKKILNFDSLKSFFIFFVTKNMNSIKKTMKIDADFFLSTYTIQNFKQ